MASPPRHLPELAQKANTFFTISFANRDKEQLCKKILETAAEALSETGDP